MEPADSVTIDTKITMVKVPTKPFQGQKPGTSGLRKKVSYLPALYFPDHINYYLLIPFPSW